MADRVALWRTDRLHDRGVYEDDPTLYNYGVFDQQSLRAGVHMSASAGNAVSVNGAAEVYLPGGTVAITAGGDLTVEGTLPDGAAPADTLAANAELRATAGISLMSGGELFVAGSGQLTVDDGGQGAASHITLASESDLTIEGSISSLVSVDVAAAGDVFLGSQITTGEASAILSAVTTAIDDPADARAVLTLTRPLTTNIGLALTAGGVITSVQADPDVDLTADAASLTAGSGIHGLDVAFNVLTHAVTTNGVVELNDLDGVGGQTTGLEIVLAVGPVGVTLQSEGDLDIEAVRALGPDADVRLTSHQGNMVLREMTSGAGHAVRAASRVVLDAAGLLDTRGGVAAPRRMEFRSGGAFIKPAGDSLDLTSEEILIRSSESIAIDGALRASRLVDLHAGTNVTVFGTISGINGVDGGVLDQLSIRADGIRDTVLGVLDEASGMQVWVEKSDPQAEYLYDFAEDRFFRNTVNGRYGFVATSVNGTTIETDTYYGVNADGSGSLYTGPTAGTLISASLRDSLSHLNRVPIQVVVDRTAVKPKTVTLQSGIVEFQNTDVTARNLVRLHADKEIIGKDLGLTLTGSSGEIDIAVGGDLTLDAGTSVRANRRISLASSKGALNILGTISGVNGPTRNVDLAAVTDLFVGASSTIDATDRISLSAGEHLSGDLDLRAGGVDGSIELYSGQDLDLTTPQLVAGDESRSRPWAISRSAKETCKAWAAR